MQTSRSMPAARPARTSHIGQQMHIAAIDGLRGVAAISVMLYHGFVGNSHGWLAVDFFFCLSGFVIALAYEDKLQQGLSIGRYMSWRFLRVYPMLFIGAVLGVILWRYNPEPRLLEYPQAYQFYVAIVAHFLLIPFVFSAYAYPFNNVQWSILYELGANLLHALSARIGTDLALYMLLLVSGLYLAIRAFWTDGIGHGFNLNYLDVSIARTIFPFFLGVLMFRKREAILRVMPSINFWWLPAVILAMASVHNLDWPSHRIEIVRQLVTAMAINPLLIALALKSTGSKGAVVVALGELSFPLYAVHEPLVATVVAMFSRVFDGAALKLAVLAACVPIALLAYLLGHYVDLPLNRLRRRYFK